MQRPQQLRAEGAGRGQGISRLTAEAGCASGPATVLARLREGQLDENPGDKLLPLKNGGEIEAGWGRVYLADLKELLDRHPDQFRGLLALAQGKREEASAETLRFLEECRIFLREGQIMPDVRDVLLSAYQETPEGPVLVNPFRFSSQEEAREVERGRRQAIERVMRDILDSDDDRNKGDPPMRR